MDSPELIVAAPETETTRVSNSHLRRLRAIYRSAGWPCQDTLEIELLAAHLLERVCPDHGPERVRVTDLGIQHLDAALTQNRKALDRHEALVQRVAEQQVLQGRIAYQGLSLLTKPGEQWLHLKPDVFSIRNTSREDYVEPVVHEIKVSRADLKTDLKKPEKRAGYIALSSECYYVLAEGIAQPEEVPLECGVIVARATGLETVRVSPKRAMKLGFHIWIALAKSNRFHTLDTLDSEL